MGRIYVKEKEGHPYVRMVSACLRAGLACLICGEDMWKKVHSVGNPNINMSISLKDGTSVDPRHQTGCKDNKNRYGPFTASMYRNTTGYAGQLDH